MGRASTWAPGSMPGGVWSPDMLAGLYWNMAPQHPVGHPAALGGQQGAAAAAFQRGVPGPTGDWRTVAQAAAAAASQLEISKLSGSKSARSDDLAGAAPLVTPSASFGNAQTAPLANLGTVQAPEHFIKVLIYYTLHRFFNVA